MVRGETVIDDCTVIDGVFVEKNKTAVETVDGHTIIHAGDDAWFYSVDVADGIYREVIVFPYQKPGDDFETIINQAKNPSTITAPVPEPA